MGNLQTKAEKEYEFEAYYLMGNLETKDEKEYAKEYYRKKAMSEDRERKRKPVHSVAMEYVEDDDKDDEFYQNKILELHEKMRKKVYGQEDSVAVQVESKKSKKSKHPMNTKKKQEIVDNMVTQRLKQFITNEINGKEVKLVIQKKLFASDLAKGQNRLNMPMNQLEVDDFLTKEEKKYLGNGLEVHLLGPRLEFHNKPMVLTFWQLKSTINYVLKTNWNNFVMANREDLKEDTLIQVWSFRLEGKLCFAIACLDSDDDQDDVA